MTHPTTPLTTHADQIAHYAAIKRRLYGKPQKKKAIEPPKEVVLAWKKSPPLHPALPVKPLWKCHSIYFNDHVMRWRMRAVTTPADWLRDRCHELGYSHKEIVGRSRKFDAVKRRHQLIYEASEKFNLSLPQLGRVFGGLDHTTILNAIRRHKERMNADD